VRKNGVKLIEYSVNAKPSEQPVNLAWAEPENAPRREVATEPPAPKDIASADELFITAEHLDQYRHPTRMPESYLDELLKRDPEDSRAHTLYGRRLIYRGLLKEAEAHLVRAVRRLTHRHPNPYTGEALYFLGLSRELQGKLDAAYPCYYKATWNGAFRAAGYCRLAAIDARRGDWAKSKEHAAESLVSDARNEKAKMMADGDVSSLLRKPFNIDMALDAAYDLVEIGRRDKAVELLKNTPANTLSKYVLAWLLRGTDEEKSALAEAAKSSPDYFFPSRIEDYLALKWCDEASGFRDANVAYALGNWLYDRKRHEEALQCWERATSLNPTFPTAWRNLGVALWNVRRDGKAAQEAYIAALKADPSDARILAEFDQLKEKCGVSSSERLKFLESHLSLVLSRDDATVQYVTCLNDTRRHNEALKVLSSHRFHPWEGGEGKVLAQYTRAHLELGRTALESGDFANALHHADKSFDTPHNLGEAYHLLQAKADVNYLRGMALRGLGRADESKAALLAAAEEAGDFQAMAVTEYSELSYWRGLALKELGRIDDAKALFTGMKAFAEKGLATPFKIDYFATSLPLLLIFEDDLEAVKNARMENIKTLAERGLEGIKGGRPGERYATSAEFRFTANRKEQSK
jgi:tetratricopeptide (TPR) repeat protein